MLVGLPPPKTNWVMPLASSLSEIVCDPCLYCSKGRLCPLLETRDRCARSIFTELHHVHLSLTSDRRVVYRAGKKYHSLFDMDTHSRSLECLPC